MYYTPYSINSIETKQANLANTIHPLSQFFSLLTTLITFEYDRSEH